MTISPIDRRMLYNYSPYRDAATGGTGDIPPTIKYIIVPPPLLPHHLC